MNFLLLWDSIIASLQVSFQQTCRAKVQLNLENNASSKKLQSDLMTTIQIILQIQSIEVSQVRGNISFERLKKLCIQKQATLRLLQILEYSFLKASYQVYLHQLKLYERKNENDYRKLHYCSCLFHCMFLISSVFSCHIFIKKLRYKNVKDFIN